MYTVGSLKDSVSGILSGVKLDKVTGLYKALERAARKLVQKADVPEATQRKQITLFDNVFDYSLENSEVFGGAIIDLRPSGDSRSIIDTVAKRPIAFFDRHKHYLPYGYGVTFEWLKGVPIIRITSAKPTAKVTIDFLNQTTGWTLAGTGSSLTQDGTVFYDTSSSLRFALTGSGTATLTKTLTSKLDISSYKSVATAFLAIRIPENTTASNLTSISLKLGSSDSAYDEVTATTGQIGDWKSGDWALVPFDFSGATSTGTPDWNNIDYVQVSIVHAGAFTNFRVGGLWIGLPSPHELIYQTSAIFLRNGEHSQTITNDDDEIILSDASYNLYEHECALAIAIQKTMYKKANQIRSILYGGEDRVGLYDQYRGDNPSEELRQVGSYYQEYGTR